MRQGFYIEWLANDRGIRPGKHWQDWEKFCKDSRFSEQEAEEQKELMNGLDEYKGEFIPNEDTNDYDNGNR